MSFFGIFLSSELILASIILIIILFTAYIGISKTIKATLSAYPAFFVADIFSIIIPSLFPNFKVALIKDNAIETTITISEKLTSHYIIVAIKILIFLAILIALIKISFFQIEKIKCGSSWGNIFLFFIIYLSFSLLILNILFLLYSGYSIVGFDESKHVLSTIMNQSFIMTLFVKYHGIFFSIPPIILILSSFLYSESNNSD